MNYLNYDRYNQRTKQDQNASTNLDQDLANSRTVRYNNAQAEAKLYIRKVLAQSKYNTLIDTKFATQYDSLDLMEILKDGEVLCRLALELKETYPTSKFKNSKMPFVQMENISFFLKTCELINLPHDEIFQTVDLYESKDPYQVIITLMSFSRIANGINPQAYSTIMGARPVKIKPPVPNKPYKLRN